MTERAQVVQKTQIGVEATPGTPVAASKLLQATEVDTNLQAQTQVFRPMGTKYSSVVAEQREWVEAPVKGYPSYGDIVYLLSSVVGTSVVTQFMDGLTPTTVYKWAFDSSTYVEDTPKVYTIEQGSAVRAGRYPYAIMRELGLKFTRQTVDITGNFLAQRFQDGITMTAAPTAIELVPMLSNSFDLFIDPTFGALGTTKIGRLFDGEWKLGNRYGGIWPVDSSQTSWAAHVELAPALSFKMIVEADSAGMGYLTTLRAGSSVFSRIKSVGPMIYNAGAYAATPLNYQMTIDTAMKVKNVGNFSDQEGVYAIDFEFEGVNDSGWNKAYHIEVQNKIAAL